MRTGVMAGCALAAACALLAACALPPDFLRVGPSPSETAAGTGDLATLPVPEAPGSDGAGTAGVTFTVVPDPTAKASWSAPPRGGE